MAEKVERYLRKVYSMLPGNNKDKDPQNLHNYTLITLWVTTLHKSATIIYAVTK